MNSLSPRLLALLFTLLSFNQAAAVEIRAAVASNFAPTLRQLADEFEKINGHRIVLVTGSTGKHYAQIRNGAPFDLYFAADTERPQRLESEGLGVMGSRFTYAIGRLVLWSPQLELVDEGGGILKRGGFRYLAIANPKLAPYGRAAKEFLRQQGLWAGLKGRMVRGENIGQAFQFVMSGNAELGLVASSQSSGKGGSHWEVPQSSYSPIEQQALLIRANPISRDFLAFVQSDQGKSIIRAAGYRVP